MLLPSYLQTPALVRLHRCEIYIERGLSPFGGTHVCLWNGGFHAVCPLCARFTNDIALQSPRVYGVLNVYPSFRVGNLAITRET